MFQVFFSSHGERAFGALSPKIQQIIVDEINRLAQDVAWYRRVKKLRGSTDRYRLRVGRWRVLFVLRGKEMEVFDVFLKTGRSNYRRRT